MHAAPADLAFGGEAFAVVGRDRRRLPEGLDHVGGVALRVLGPVLDPAGGVDADHARRANAPLRELAGDGARLPDGGQECVTPRARIDGCTPAGRFPDRRDNRADRQASRRELVDPGLELVVGAVNADVRLGQEQVHAIELPAIDLGIGSQVKHRLEGDGRFVIRPVSALAHDTRPSGIVQFWEVVAVVHGDANQ